MAKILSSGRVSPGRVETLPLYKSRVGLLFTYCGSCRFARVDSGQSDSGDEVVVRKCLTVFAHR